MHFIDLGAQRQKLEPQLREAVERVLEGGQYILGKEVAEFEQRLADYIGVKHAIGCANGTDALLLPLMAAGIGPGDAVFCPSFTFAATAEVIALRGAEPVFVDVDPDHYNISIPGLEAAIASIRAEGRLRPRAIIPVDLFGMAMDHKAIAAIASREDLLVIEDAAQAVGGMVDGGKCGSLGDVGATSFYPAKPLGCYGDGGAMFTDDDAMAELLRSLAFHGKGGHQYDNVRIGINSRLDTLQAAILLVKLSVLEEEMQTRQVVAARYGDGLKDLVKVPQVPASHRSAFALYAIELEERDSLKAFLAARNIPSVVYYPKPLHLQPAYVNYPRQPHGLPVAESLPERILCLPMHPYLAAADQDRIIDSVREYLRARPAVAAE